MTGGIPFYRGGQTHCLISSLFVKLQGLTAKHSQSLRLRTLFTIRNATKYAIQKGREKYSPTLFEYRFNE